jgi:hypothetical protein
MRTLYLHAGHGKTGSSFVQSALALSTDFLAQSGITYPDLTNSFQDARAGRITSGNVHTNIKPLIAYARDAHEQAPEGHALLFSHEMLFGYLLQKDAPQLLGEIQQAGFDVRVLCFIRDPMEHAVSLYQQTVKRSGNTNSLVESLEGYAQPRKVLRVMETMQELGISIQVSNYSRHRRALLAVIENFLSIPRDSLKKPDFGVVNRSLTAGELALQSAFNRFYGKGSHRLISDPLCNDLPDIKSEFPALREAQLATFLKRMRGLVLPVNARLPENEHYHVPRASDAISRFRDPYDPKLLSFSHDQLEVIARELSNYMRALEEKAKT